LQATVGDRGGATRIASHPKPATPGTPRFGRLAPDELAPKWANRECYHCQEKYTPDHKCAGKGKQLELDDAREMDDAAEALGISLRALTDIDVGAPMKLQIYINDTPLVAIVDSSSTHRRLSRSRWPPSLACTSHRTRISRSRSRMATTLPAKVSPSSNVSPSTPRTSTLTVLS
jgi:hypothetical protein